MRSLDARFNVVQFFERDNTRCSTLLNLTKFNPRKIEG